MTGCYCVGFPDIYLCVAMVPDHVCIGAVSERGVQSDGPCDGGGERDHIQSGAGLTGEQSGHPRQDGHGGYDEGQGAESGVREQSLGSGLRVYFKEPRGCFCPLPFDVVLPLPLGFDSLWGTSPWSIKFSQIFCVCFIVFLYMSAGCVSTFRTCVQGYLEWLPFVFCFLPSLHAL